MNYSYAACDRLCKRIKRMITHMEESAHDTNDPRLLSAKKKLIREFIAVCKQNNVDVKKILSQNGLEMVYDER